MSRSQYIFVNGILSKPEDVVSWTDRAVFWINKADQAGDLRADKMEYECGIFSRRFYQNDRVKNLQKIAKNYNGDRVVLVGHSNGCDIIERVVRKGTPKIHELHLIAAASQADFKKNGYNRALKNGLIENIYIYMSPIDEALEKARLSTQLFGWMGLGYGYMGLTGPLNVDPSIKHKVFVYKYDFGHSDWFSRKNFESTMRAISRLT